MATDALFIPDMGHHPFVTRILPGMVNLRFLELR